MALVSSGPLPFIEAVNPDQLCLEMQVTKLFWKELTMGANLFFDRMLPAEGPETKPGDQRQLEVFTLGGKVFVRIGPLNEENAGLNRYTVEVTPAALKALQESLQLLPDFVHE